MHRLVVRRYGFILMAWTFGLLPAGSGACVNNGGSGGGQANPFERPADVDEDVGSNGTTDGGEGEGEGEGDDEPNDDGEPDVRAEALSVDPVVDHFKGDPESAPNVIVEYSNFRCSHCADFFAETLSDIEALVDDGSVVYVFRHIAPSEDARLASAAAECAALQIPSVFFDYHDLLFENQTALTSDMLRESLVQFGRDMGVDSFVLDQCLTNEATTDRVDRDALSAQTLEVTVTPTFFVNGEMLVGNQPIEAFEPFLTE
ncbi:MAG: thioredoxin domain-containing protein [bacterium]|nr:thioredoxin domain-containing protein [bacterium]